jgi:hypothetical protein
VKRGEAMDTAKGYITKDRQQTHGKPEDTFGDIAGYWSTYLGMKIMPHDVAALMALLKIARIGSNPFHEDNWVDGAGYMGCGVELATEMSDDDLDAANDAIEYALTAKGLKLSDGKLYTAPEGTSPLDLSQWTDLGEVTKVSLHTSDPGIETASASYGYAPGNITWTAGGPMTVTNVAMFDSSAPEEEPEPLEFEISDEQLDQVEEAISNQEASKRAFFEKLKKQYPWLPATIKTMKTFHIWRKEGEITHEPRWFIGLQWEANPTRPGTHVRYEEYYLHGYEQWVMTVQNPDDGEGVSA